MPQKKKNGMGTVEKGVLSAVKGVMKKVKKKGDRSKLAKALDADVAGILAAEKKRKKARESRKKVNGKKVEEKKSSRGERWDR